MAKFLTTADTSAAIERVIRNAQHRLVLISAYVIPRVVYYQRLVEAGERGVRITMIFGKRSMHNGVFQQLGTIPNFELYYLPELHAKCYLNELEVVVTSLNLLNSSEANNREMGVLLTASKDREAFDDAHREAASILRVAECVHKAPPTEFGTSAELIIKWKARVGQWRKLEELRTPMDDRMAVTRRTHPRAYAKWHPEEQELLLEFVRRGMSMDDIATILQRQVSAVKSRLDGRRWR